MPIRMTDDPRSGGSGSRPHRRSSGGGGGGGGIGALLFLLPRLIMFGVRNPKTSLVLIVVAVIIYFFFGRGGGFDGVDSSNLSTGCDLNQEAYDSVLVYEPLSGNGGLPESVSLLAHAPMRMNQGSQGSCVGWATSYAARTILYAKQQGIDPNAVTFSPSFLYNQIALAGCEGTYLRKAMEVMTNRGDLFLSKFPYDEHSCDDDPNAKELAEARAFRIEGYQRLSEDHDDYAVSLQAIKQNLAQGGPVVIGMSVGGSFMEDMDGVKVWHPTGSDYDQVDGWGGHAMCVTGYNDALEGGAFEVMNSWGPEWGDEGVAWIRYEDFSYFVREAYGIYNMGDAAKVREQEVNFGLVRYDMSGDNFTAQGGIPLKKLPDGSFLSKTPIQVGTRFKVEFQNTIPCYAYIFGQETDGSSYVLFPYTEKHSPYCGTTGTRIFPKDQSLTADGVGQRDFIAVVISYEPLVYDELNSKISKAPGKDYLAKLRAGLGSLISRKSTIEVKGDRLELKSSETDPKLVHAMVIGFDKRR